MPEKAKNANSHLNDLKEEFSSFFNEESGNSTVEESLDEEWTKKLKIWA